MAGVFKKRESYIAQTYWSGVKAVASLGRMDKAAASLARQMITELERSRSAGSTPSKAVHGWLESLSVRMHEALERLGLVEPRIGTARDAIPTTIQKLFKDYTDRRKGEMAERSIVNIRQAGDSMVECLGQLRAISRVTPADAERWEKWMRNGGKSRATISGHIKKAKQVFDDAVRNHLIPSNPLKVLKAGDQVNEQRSRFVPRNWVDRVSAVCDPQWRLLIALSRYAGLRVPSEVARLTWADVKRDEGVIVVKSKKMAHLGKTERRVPIFPELVKPLADAYSARDHDTDKMIPMMVKGYNPHTQMVRLVRRAGLEPWPRIFHNLRASRQTELEESFPLHVVCRWMGNSPTTARKHYLQVTGEHLSRASVTPEVVRGIFEAHRAPIDTPQQAKNDDTSVPVTESLVSTYPQGVYNKSRSTERKSKGSRSASTAPSVKSKPYPRKTPDEWMRFNERRSQRWLRHSSSVGPASSRSNRGRAE